MIEKLLEIAWTSYMDYWEDSKEKFFDRFKGHIVYPVTNKNKVVGCVAVRENQIHLFTVDNYNLRPIINNILKPLLNEYDEVRSTIHVMNYNAYKFVTRLGFEPFRLSGNTLYIRITKNGLCW
jgi:hypothetical protein